MALFGNNWKEDSEDNDDGSIFFKHWREDMKSSSETHQESIDDLLDKMTSSERLKLFSRYCKDCGKKNLNCQCINH